jgi:hypothetical protein
VHIFIIARARPFYFALFDLQFVIALDAIIVSISLSKNVRFKVIKTLRQFFWRLPLFLYISRITGPISVSQTPVKSSAHYRSLLLRQTEGNYLSSNPVAGKIVAVNWDRFSSGCNKRRQTVVVEWQTHKRICIYGTEPLWHYGERSIVSAIARARSCSSK